MSNNQSSISSSSFNSVLRILNGANWLDWNNDFLDICPKYGTDGHSIMSGVEVPFVKPEKTDLVTYKKATEEDDQVFVDALRPWSRHDETTHSTAVTIYNKRESNRGELWYLMRKSTTPAIKTKVENRKKEFETARRDSNVYGLYQIYKQVSKEAAKVGATASRTKFTNTKQQPGESIESFIKFFEDSLLELEQSGETFSESAKVALLGANIERHRYENAIVDVYKIAEDHENYPKYEQVRTDLINWEVSTGGTATAGNAATGRTSNQEANNTRAYAVGASKYAQSIRHTERTQDNPAANRQHAPRGNKSQQTQQSNGLPVFCQNCDMTPSTHKTKDCPCELATCQGCHKVGHLHQHCNSSRADANKDNNRKGGGGSDRKGPDRRDDRGGHRRDRSKDRSRSRDRGGKRRPERRDNSRDRTRQRRDNSRDRGQQRRDNSHDRQQRRDNSRDRNSDRREGGSKKKGRAFAIRESDNRSQNNSEHRQDRSSHRDEQLQLPVLLETWNLDQPVPQWKAQEWLNAYLNRAGNLATELPDIRRLKREITGIPFAYLCGVYRAGHDSTLFTSGRYKYDMREVTDYWHSLRVSEDKSTRTPIAYREEWEERNDHEYPDSEGDAATDSDKSGTQRFARRMGIRYDRSLSKSPSKYNYDSSSSQERAYMTFESGSSPSHNSDMVSIDSCCSMHIETDLKYVQQYAVINDDPGRTVSGIGDVALACTHTGYIASIGAFRVVPGAGASLASASMLAKHKHVLTIDTDEGMTITNRYGTTIRGHLNKYEHYEVTRADFMLLQNAGQQARAYPVQSSTYDVQDAFLNARLSPKQNAATRAGKHSTKALAKAPIFTKEQRIRADQVPRSRHPMSQTTAPSTARA